MTDNPRVLITGGDTSITTATDKVTSTPWNRLRQQAEQTKEEIKGMDTAQALSFCIGNFLVNTRAATEKSPNVRSAVNDLENVIDSELAKRIAKDELLVASIPGKELRSVVTVADNKSSVSGSLKMYLRAASWLDTGSPETNEVLKASLFYILSASFGVDPGPADSIRPLKEISASIMRGEFDESNPPAPFSKSPSSSIELQIKTGVEGVSLTIDQNSQLYLSLESTAVEGIIKEANIHLAEANIQPLPPSEHDDLGLVGRKQKFVMDFLTKS